MNTAGSGNWSAGATWVGGVPPTAADTAVILSTHTVTLDNTSCVALSLTVNSGGTLAASTTANSTLTLQGGGVISGTFNIALSANNTYSCNVVINAASSGSDTFLQINPSATIDWSGFPRKRITTLTTAVTTSGAASTQATVTDATGWKSGDVICFGTTQAYNATPKIDIITLNADPVGNVITWTGSATNAHDIGGYVGNFSSNVTVQPLVAGFSSYVFLAYNYSSGYQTKNFSNVLFTGMFGSNYQTYAAWGVVNTGGAYTTDIKTTLNDCAFYQYKNSAVGLGGVCSPLVFNRNCFYSSAIAGFFPTINSTPNGVTSYSGTTFNGFGVFRSTGTQPSSGYDGRDSGVSFVDSFISGCSSAGLHIVGTGAYASNVEIFSNSVGVSYDVGTLTAAGLNVGTFNASNGSTTTNASADTHVLLCDYTLTNSTTQNLALTGIANCIPSHSLTFVNKSSDVAQQEIYRPFMSIKRENTIKNRSTSSIAIRPTKVSTNCQRTLSIPCANGSSIRVIGYVQRQSSATQVATVAVSGLGSAWGGFTAANNTSWQVWDTGTITNSSGADGNFTLTYTASDSSSTSGVVYFDGVPDSPFVTKCRHYGFTFDEANPVRTENTVLTTLGVTETTAIGYTGVTISPTQITVGAGTADTWLKVYGYAQAHACDDLTTTVNLTSTDGNTFSLPTSYKLSWPTMGTDGTLAGGWLLLAATGTHTYKLSGTKIEFQAAGSYTMSASTFSGTVELANSSGGAVTVYLPSGTSYTPTGPALAALNITVSTPIIQQSVTLTGVVAGSRVQIYDTTNSIELFNGTSGYSWTDTVAAVAPRDIRVRIAYQSGTTAYNFVEANIGTCGITSPSNAVTYLASQTLDTVYNANGLDGSAVSGITISDGIDRMAINIGGGSVSWPQIYAYNVYWLTTSAGIVDDGSIIVARDTANYSVSLFKIRNNSATPLNITGGYGTDSSTGTVAPLIDTAGSTGNIYQTPDHVVAYQTTGTYAITGDISTVLTAVGNVPTGVRTELTTELARIDVATSTRLSTAGYTAPTTPPTAAAIAAQVLADAAATPIAANTKAINGVTLQGAGTTLDPMRPV